MTRITFEIEIGQEARWHLHRVMLKVMRDLERSARRSNAVGRKENKLRAGYGEIHFKDAARALQAQKELSAFVRAFNQAKADAEERERRGVLIGGVLYCPPT